MLAPALAVALVCAYGAFATAPLTPAPAPLAPLAPTGDLVVGVLVQPPFVDKSASGEYSGFAVELWEAIAHRTSTSYSYREYATVQLLVDAVSTSAVDIAVTDLTVTGTRLQHMEFCQPYFHTGLTIMINEQRRS